MPIRFARRLALVLLAVFLLSGSHCHHGSAPHASAPAMSAFNFTGGPNGGQSAPPAAMNSQATILANLIVTYRQQDGLAPTLTANNTLTGVAQWQANDMATHNYVGLVGSDEEDVFTRLANSGYPNGWVGVVVAGYNTNAQAVFNAMKSDAANSTLLYNGTNTFSSIGVGYSNGYWMVILGGKTGSSSGSSGGTSGTTVVPSAPTLSAAGGASSVSLSWTASTGATSYNIYRGTASGGETLYQSSVTGISYSDTAVTNGTTYYYKVAAVNSSGTSSQSNEASATPSASGGPPSTPTLTATAGTGSVSLSWTVSAGATSYTIYRGTASGGETVYQTSVTVTSYSDTAVTNGTTYYYKVLAVNSSGTSSLSNEASATPTGGSGGAPAAPTLTSVVADPTIPQATLTWTASAGATSYTIYRGTASGGETSYMTGVTGTTYTDTGVTNGTTYYYTVVAVNSSGSSSQSNELSAPIPLLLVAVPSGGIVGLAWTPAAGATSYTISRGTVSGGETTYMTGVTGISYADTSVTVGTTYYYTISAVGTSNSYTSPEASATP